jgi:hypothetical protein
MAAVVARFNVTPVKSFAVEHPDTIELTPTGARDDRRFVLLDAGGRLYNGKRDGRLTRIRATWDPRAGVLELAFPDGTVLAGEVDRGMPVVLDVYGRRMVAHDVVGPWADALSDFAGQSLRLVERGDGDVATDVAPATLISNATLAEIDGDGRRYRMLLEIDGIETQSCGSAIRSRSSTVDEVSASAAAAADPDAVLTALVGAAIEPAVILDDIEASQVEQPPPLERREPVQAHRRGRLASAHRERQGARDLIPVGALENAALALEPATVGLGDVLCTGAEHVEHEAAARLEQRASGLQGTELLVLVGHVQQRAERADHERYPFFHRRISQVAGAEIDQLVDAPVVCERSCHGQHPLRLVDADDADTRLRNGNRDPSGADGELHHRPSGVDRLLDVEADVLDDGPAPGVVDRCDRIVERHAGSVPVPGK